MERRKEMRNSIIVKTISLMITLSMMLIALSGCSSLEKASSVIGENNDLFSTTTKEDKAQEIYDLLISASEMAEKMGSDTYTAWNDGIHEADEAGYDLYDLAENLSLSADDLKKGFAYAANEDEWETMTDEEKEEKINSANKTFSLYLAISKSQFSLCVEVVTNAYIVTGKSDEIKSTLNEAKSKLKDLNEDYPDYEVYTKLKNFYTKIQIYYDYCMNPTGSFNELQNIIKEFRTDVREAKNELSFDFD